MVPLGAWVGAGRVVGEGRPLGTLAGLEAEAALPVRMGCVSDKGSVFPHPQCCRGLVGSPCALNTSLVPSELAFCHEGMSPSGLMFYRCQVVGAPKTGESCRKEPQKSSSWVPGSCTEMLSCWGHEILGFLSVKWMDMIVPLPHGVGGAWQAAFQGGLR